MQKPSIDQGLQRRQWEGAKERTPGIQFWLQRRLVLRW
jgi:hypothetical protein